MQRKNDEAHAQPTHGPRDNKAKRQQNRSARPAVEQDDDDAIVSVDGFRELLPDAWYEARYTGHQTAVVFMAPKCFLEFEVVQPGEYMGIKLFRAFRVRRLVGRPGRAGQFVPHAGGDLYALLVRLLDVKLRTDRITLRPLRHMLFRIRTRTVTKNHAQQERPEQSRYSVVAEIERGE